MEAAPYYPEQSTGRSSPLAYLQDRVASSFGPSYYDPWIALQFRESFRGDLFSAAHFKETLRIVKYVFRNQEAKDADALLHHLRTDGAWDGAPSTESKQQGQELLWSLQEAAGMVGRFDMWLREADAAVSAFIYPISNQPEAAGNMYSYPLPEERE